MKNYHYPLIMGGAALMLLGAQPAQAMNTDFLDSNQNQEIFGEGVADLNFKHNDSSATRPLELICAETFALENNLPSLETVSKDLSHYRETDHSFALEENLVNEDKSKSPQSLKKEIKDSENLIAQTPMIAQPEIIIKESEQQILQPNTPSTPVMPRAVAPPVGDIAISNIDPSAETINLGTNAIVPRLVLREAPVREVLAVLARYAGLNVVFLDQAAAAQGDGAQGAAAGAQQTISLDLENESVQNVFNSVLMVSGMKASRKGGTVFVGATLPTAARNLISRTMRLNQVSAVNAATFLASQGAEYQRLVTEQEDIVDPLTNRTVGRRDKPPTLQPLTTQKKSSVAFLLDGLTVATDERLNSLTLIGEPRQVQIATSMLIQLDARRRQVAVNVKVIDVNLRGEEYFKSSFSFGFNDGFFVNDGGEAFLNFGGVNPATAAQFRSSVFTPPIIPITQAVPGTIETFYDYQKAPFNNFTSGPVQYFDQNPDSPTFGQIIEVPQTSYVRPSFGTNNNPLQSGVSSVPDFENIVVGVDPNTGIPIIAQVPTSIQYSPPTLFQFPNKFLATLQARITSGNAKILTDPTLVVQEGQQGTVKLTQKVIESVNSQVDPLSGVRTTTPVLADAGLTLSVEIERIDDNGFVNLYVSPTIAAPGATEEFASGVGSTNRLTLLTRREMTSGLIRLRDGQTLVLSGIISETERTTVAKVPILGDIPLLGALFRSTTNNGERTEVIILLTPKIIDDNQDSTFGYGYQPGKDAAEILRRQGFPVQPNQ